MATCNAKCRTSWLPRPAGQGSSTFNNRPCFSIQGEKWLWKRPNVNFSPPHLYAYTHMHINPLYILLTYVHTYTTASKTNQAQKEAQKSFPSYLLISNQGQSAKENVLMKRRIINANFYLWENCRHFPYPLIYNFYIFRIKTTSVNKICFRNWILISVLTESRERFSSVFVASSSGCHSRASKKHTNRD